MELSEITELLKRFVKPGYGTVAPDEVDFIQSLIVKHKPKSFIEIGMASGMSTGFIARFMDAQGGGRLVSLDHDDTFFGDTTKPNGFLYPEIYQGDKVQSELVKFKTALDIHEIEGQFDMAFIDANHQQPWPAIDMMALYPRMTGPRIMVHHDLRLFMTQNNMFGIGPKFLFDQFPESHRQRSTANNGNIFAVDLNMDQARFEVLLTDLIKLPWSVRTPISPAYVAKIEAILKRDYSPTLHSHFMRCLEHNNTPPQVQDSLMARIEQLQGRVKQLQASSGKGLISRLMGKS
jgi:hypothetical protein